MSASIGPTRGVQWEAASDRKISSKNMLEQKEKTEQVAKKIFWTIAIIFNPVSDYFTQALSDSLCLETLRHGTSLPNYLNIRVMGADPAYGGKENGSTLDYGLLIAGGDDEAAERLLEGCENRFHVFKDTEADFDGLPCLKSAADLAVRTLGPRIHAFLSGTKSFDKGSGIVKVIKGVAGGILGLFTPTLKFRYLPSEIDQVFDDDPKYGGFAYKTAHKIGIDRIGLAGTLKYGKKGDLAGRIKKNPNKAISGLVRLIIPIVICYLLIRQ